MRTLVAVVLSLVGFGLHGCSSDVSDDPKLRGGYSKGQTLRLRVDAYAYTFNEARHPAESATQITAAKDLKPHDVTARAEWQRRNAATIVAHLPAGAAVGSFRRPRCSRQTPIPPPRSANAVFRSRPWVRLGPFSGT